MTTPRQIAANHNNAKRSTGPQSPEGQRAACRNSLLHGYTGRGFVLPEQMDAELQRRLAEFRRAYPPLDAFDERDLHDLALESVRIDRLTCDETERLVQRRLEYAAMGDAGDQDEAAVLFQELPKAPARIRAKLRQTTRGCDQLLAALRAFVACLEAGGAISASTLNLIHDCLGTPRPLRSLPNALADGPEPDQIQPERALLTVRAEIASLERLQADPARIELELRRRAAAELTLGWEPTAEEKLQRRYLTSCQNRYDRTLKRMLARRAARMRPESCGWYGVTVAEPLPPPCGAAPSPPATVAAEPAAAAGPPLTARASAAEPAAAPAPGLVGDGPPETLDQFWEAESAEEMAASSRTLWEYRFAAQARASA